MAGPGQSDLRAWGLGERQGWEVRCDSNVHSAREVCVAGGRQRRAVDDTARNDGQRNGPALRTPMKPGLIAKGADPGTRGSCTFCYAGCEMPKRRRTVRDRHAWA